MNFASLEDSISHMLRRFLQRVFRLLEEAQQQIVELTSVIGHKGVRWRVGNGFHLAKNSRLSQYEFI